MRPESASAMDKLIDTVNSIKTELESLPKITDMTILGRLEDRIRQECQVIEALPGYMGQEIYKRIQARRMEIRREHIDKIRGISKEDNGRIGSSGTNGNLGWSDKSGGAEQESDTKASRPSRQSKSKK